MNLINKELSNLGISLSSSTYHPIPEPSSAASENPFYQTQGLPGFQSQPMSPNPTEYLFQSHGGSDSFGPDPMAMEPGLFEAMSSLEPLSAWVGTIPEFDKPGLG